MIELMSAFPLENPTSATGRNRGGGASERGREKERGRERGEREKGERRGEREREQERGGGQRGREREKALKQGVVAPHTLAIPPWKRMKDIARVFTSTK